MTDRFYRISHTIASYPLDICHSEHDSKLQAHLPLINIRAHDMPTWEHIEDASAVAQAVWLTRPSDLADGTTTAPAAAATTTAADALTWKPLRKTDCQALNTLVAAQEHDDTDDYATTVYIEGGRSTADPVNGTVQHNFFRGAERTLVKAVWFILEEKSSSVTLLTPTASPSDQDKIEELYQKAVQAGSSLGTGIASVLDQHVLLSDESKVMVVKSSGGTVSMKKVPNGWFSSHLDLQRGYGEYTVEGEDNEMALGPVKHLCFVVHGIGEALFSRDDFKISRFSTPIASIISNMNKTRISIQKRQVDDWKKQCAAAVRNGLPRPLPPARIELLPIEWFSQMHDSSSSLMKSLQAATLTTIPALRAIANDVVFDVLMYLTPAFCEAVLHTVTDQINELYGAFQQVHPEFIPGGGKCSLIGHSLGSVICWDLLSILKEKSLLAQAKSSGSDSSADDPLVCHGVSVASEVSVEIGYQMYAKQAHANKARNGTWGPSLTKTLDASIPFVPECTILLGSPLGIFLTLRGAHPVFDQFRKAAAEEAQIKADAAQPGMDAPTEIPITSTFSLPTTSLYNIFHPSDPVAYRIEPLLLPQDIPADKVPPPVYLTAPGKDLRLHVKAKQFGDEIRKSFMVQKNTWNSLVQSVVNVVAAEPDSSKNNIGSDPHGLKAGPLEFPLGGTSTRVDFTFQPGVVDNECKFDYRSVVYLKLPTSHSFSLYPLPLSSLSLPPTRPECRYSSFVIFLGEFGRSVSPSIAETPYLIHMHLTCHFLSFIHPPQQNGDFQDFLISLLADNESTHGELVEADGAII